MHMANKQDTSLLDEVLEALELYGFPQSTFGTLVCSDPTLVWKMKNHRRQPRPNLEAKIRKVLDNIRNGTCAPEDFRL